MPASLLYPSDIFTYQYLAGPVLTSQEIDTGVLKGNCRFALQQYYYRVHNIFFEQDKIYLPGGYKVLGEFIFKEEPIDTSALKPGDILYAQNWRNKNNEQLHKGLEHYKDKDEWLYYLHSAIYIGELEPGSKNHYVWHATNIEGGPALWTYEKFLYYYKPISAKRVLPN